MANPYGRKGKQSTAAAPAKSAHDSSDERMQKMLQMIDSGDHESLRNAIIDAFNAKAGSVPILEPPTGIGPEEPRVTSVSKPEEVFGKTSLVRVFTDKAPGRDVKVPMYVGVATFGRDGKVVKFKRRFFSDTPVELPESAIRVLETPEIRDFREETGSEVYEAWVRGNKEPALAEAHKMGFETAEMRDDGLYYKVAIYHNTVQRIAQQQEKIFVPVQV